MADAPIVVVGGGMAGMAAALKLIERKERVIVLEKRQFLGGRATSFLDRKTQDEIDNGQHVLLGCCTNVVDLLGSVGTADQIEWSSSFTYAEPGGKRHSLARGFLPAPLHFSSSLLTFGALTLSQRLEVARAFAAMMFSSRTQLEHWRDKPFLAWLKARGQSEATIKQFWQPIVIGAVNETSEIAAATPSLQVFLEGFLPHRDAANLGVAKVGLEKLYAIPARQKIEQAGSEVRTGVNVTELLVEGDQVTGVKLKGDDVIQTSRVIFAVPAESLSRIACQHPEPLLESSFADSIKHAPIAGLHFWFDRRWLDVEHAALLETQLEWLFRKAAPGPEAQALGAKERIQGVISAAHHLHGRSQEEIIQHSLDEIHAAFPASRESQLIHAAVVRENRATLSLDPTLDTKRPGQTTSLNGCILAGDWVQTGWPGTMEGAARSGRRAAALLLGKPSNAFLAPELKRGFLASLLMARSPSPLVPIR